MTKPIKKITKRRAFEENELEKTHLAALKLVRKQIKKHSLGELGFLAFVGTRPWGFSQANVDYDYQGIYLSKEDNTYQAFISWVYINNSNKDITLISFERFIEYISDSNIHSLIFINSPIVYASEDFLGFKRRINSNPARQVYFGCQMKKSHESRKDYLYDYFFIGNGISVLERKKIVANLPELNKKCLKISPLNKIIEEERKGINFGLKSEQTCKKILAQLKTRLERAYRNSSLPEGINRNKLAKLKVLKKINYQFWSGGGEHKSEN